VTADGGPGLDRLSGGEERDTLLGGPDGDDLKGLGGDDLLRGGGGSDDLDGGPGADTLRGGDGLDQMRGGDGGDLFHAGLEGGGPDTFLGGPGIDTVTYAFASSPVSVTIFDLTDPNANASDGRAGENDYLQHDVENVVGGSGDDSLAGNNLANRIEGGTGRDVLRGATGADVLVGGDGDDTIEARDGIRDALIDCGAGAADVATIDLQDLRTRTTGCESVRFFASDDGPPGEIRSGVLRIGPTGRARVRLACPRAARVACRGGLSIRRPRSARRARPGDVSRRAREDRVRPPPGPRRPSRRTGAPSNPRARRLPEGPARRLPAGRRPLSEISDADLAADHRRASGAALDSRSGGRSDRHHRMRGGRSCPMTGGVCDGSRTHGATHVRAAQRRRRRRVRGARGR
jgi:hypothetical protein